jgi:hypothetical protein
LFEKKGSFEAQLLNGICNALNAEPGCVIGFFHFIHALPELDAFSTICFFDGRW